LTWFWLFAWAAFAPLGIATAVFVVETTLGLIPLRRPNAAQISNACSAVVLIPAHDEAAGLAAILEQLSQRIGPHTRILVVADNCTDATAEIARTNGADVIERSDATHRGKGYALACGRDFLRAVPPDCVVIVDADSLPDAGSIDLLCARAIATNRPVQSVYLLEPPPPNASPAVRLSAFAFLVKNLVRQQGASLLGAPAILTGSGMAFPWKLLADAPLANDDVAEDLSLGVWLALQGHSPLFESRARTLSASSSLAGTVTQRARWESGFLHTARRNVLPLFLAAIDQRRVGLIWLGLHLLTPAFVILLSANAVFFIGMAMAWSVGWHSALVLVSTASLLSAIIVVSFAWALYGRVYVPITTLADLPNYVVWKLGISLTALVKGERRWIRTERDQ
jgi:cellulose synthase/poly-beta-1,6-N-acetylglucosamine synthase-like glycosyltransferase